MAIRPTNNFTKGVKLYPTTCLTISNHSFYIPYFCHATPMATIVGRRDNFELVVSRVIGKQKLRYVEAIAWVVSAQRRYRNG